MMSHSDAEAIVAFSVLSAVAPPLIIGAPRMTTAVCDLLREITVIDEVGKVQVIHVPIERPLTVFVDGRELVTLMTIGGAPELLALGFLLNQRLMGAADAIESIVVDWNANRVAVTPRKPCAPWATRGGAAAESGVVPGTACGTGSVYGELVQQIGDIRLPPVADARIGESTLLSLLDTVRHYNHIHRRAGSVHGCALFQGALPLISVEDVGRHNALDTVTGWMALHGVSGGDKTLFTTGRLTIEMVMKAAQSGIPILVSRNGVSAAGYDLAIQLDMTLIGRASGRRFIIYSGASRFSSEHRVHDG